MSECGLCSHSRVFAQVRDSGSLSLSAGEGWGKGFQIRRSPTRGASCSPVFQERWVEEPEQA